MDLKNAFLNSLLSELVYMEQPSSFEDQRFSNHVSLSKLLEYVINALRIFFLKNNFEMGNADLISSDSTFSLTKLIKIFVRQICR